VTDTVVLHQAGSPRRWVLHRPVDRHGDGYVYFLQVELQDDGMSVHGWSALDGKGGPDLPAFLDQLVDRWRGWAGTLAWTSLESEMSLEATHHGSHVTLAVVLRRPHQPHAPDAWSVRVVFTLEPGEQLRNLAREASSVLTRD
jgi:hypothetical protein